MLIFVRRLQCSLRQHRRRVTRRRRLRSQRAKRKPKPTNSFKLLGGRTYLPKGDKLMDEPKRRISALRSGFLKRPSDLCELPARASRKSRRGYRSSVSFVRSYSSLVVAVHLPNGVKDFPDNYCLVKSSANNWHFLNREPSLRAARRLVAIGLDNPGRIASPLPYSVRELSRSTYNTFEMVRWTEASGERSSFPKPNITCCGARRCFIPPIFEGDRWATQLKAGLEELSSETRQKPFSYGSEVFRKVSVTFPQIKSVGQRPTK
jgi:hypothetical protein